MSTIPMIKNLIDYVRLRQGVLLVSGLSVAATVFISVSVSYHLAVTRMQTVSTFHQISLNETHAYINRTIEGVVTSLSNEMESLKTRVSTQGTGSQSERNVIKRKLRELTKKENDFEKEVKDERKALKETLDERIASLETSLGKRVDNLRINTTLDISHIREVANKSLGDLDEAQANLASLTDQLEAINGKIEENLKKIKMLSEDAKSDRIKVSNVTQMYSKVVVLSKSFLSDKNNTNDPDTAKEIIDTLETAMTHLQDSRIDDAIRRYNHSVQSYLDSRDADNQDGIKSVRDSLQRMLDRWTELMPKVLDYVSVANFGHILMVQQRMTFQYVLNMVNMVIIYFDISNFQCCRQFLPREAGIPG